jgi:hypothetical protein
MRRKGHSGSKTVCFLMCSLVVGLVAGARVSYAATVGLNEDRLDPVVIWSSGDCSPSAGWNPLASYVDECGDFDGCTIRLVSDTSDDGRASTRPVTLALNATGTEWSLSVFSGLASLQGRLDGNETLLLQARGASNEVHCEVWEREISGQLSLSLETPCQPAVLGAKITCMVRIDD